MKVNVYIFSSKTITNIWAGIGAGTWAVQSYNKPEFKTKAMKMPIGSFGLIYCVETKSFTTPFIVKTPPKDEIVDNIWPEEWTLPFSIQPLGTPRKQIHNSRISRLQTVMQSGKRWCDVLTIQPNTVFGVSEIDRSDWAILMRDLT